MLAILKIWIIVFKKKKETSVGTMLENLAVYNAVFHQKDRILPIIFSNIQRKEKKTFPIFRYVGTLNNKLSRL